MTVLIVGGAGSGKSAYAERLAVQLARMEKIPPSASDENPPSVTDRTPPSVLKGMTSSVTDENLPPDESVESRLLYIAAMEPFGDEAAGRIARHRAQRRGQGFVTTERYRDLAGLAVPDGCTALLEDLGNLCANELFRPDGEGVVSQAENTVLSGLEHLRVSCRHVVVVTNEAFCGGTEYAGDTDAWLRLLAAVNRKTAALSEGVCEVVCGVPCWYRDPWGRETAFPIVRELKTAAKQRESAGASKGGAVCGF